MKTDRLLATALAVGALASLGSVARAAAPPPPTGDAAAIELARTVNAHYAAKARMAVELSSSMPGGVVVKTRLVLARGNPQAMISTAAARKERMTTVISPRGAYVREPGKRCWTRIGAGASLGDSMISMPGSRFLAPESIGALTRLEVVERDPSSGTRSRVVYKVDPATGRIATVISGGIVMSLKALPRVPVLPTFKPVCKA